MPMLERPEGDLYYHVCDIVPPWVTPKETILFLNGLAINADIWITWLPELVDRYRVVRTDLRGFGRSFRPPPGSTWSIDDLARDVLDVMRAVDAPRVHFVGESTGGTVGMYLAAAHPDAIATLTPVSAAHAGSSIAFTRQLTEDVEALGMAGWSDKLMDRRFHPGTVDPLAHEWFRQEQAASPAHACVDLVKMLVGTDLTDRLGQITAPTLILAPDDSPFVAVEEQVRRLRAMPNATLQVIAGARHGVSFSHGPACARALRTFIDRQAGGAREPGR